MTRRDAKQTRNRPTQLIWKKSENTWIFVPVLKHWTIYCSAYLLSHKLWLSQRTRTSLRLFLRMYVTNMMWSMSWSNKHGGDKRNTHTEREKEGERNQRTGHMKEDRRLEKTRGSNEDKRRNKNNEKQRKDWKKETQHWLLEDSTIWWPYFSFSTKPSTYRQKCINVKDEILWSHSCSPGNEPFIFYWPHDLYFTVTIEDQNGLNHNPCVFSIDCR